jgi:hypothetical protein
MTSQAQDALRKILALRKYPYPQSPLAEARLLKNLNVADYIEVISALENPNATSTSVSRE